MVTWPEEGLQPTPSQRQQSVPFRHDESLVVDLLKEKDFCSWRSALDWFGWHKNETGKCVRLPPSARWAIEVESSVWSWTRKSRNTQPMEAIATQYEPMIGLQCKEAQPHKADYMNCLV
jgi:hypothetical protein